MTLRTRNYGNYGIFLIVGHAGFLPSTVLRLLTLALVSAAVNMASSCPFFIRLLTGANASLLLWFGCYDKKIGANP